jgi:hypothetical protein
MVPNLSRFSTLAAVLAVAAVLVPATAGAHENVLPTLYVAYAMNCTFAISDDAGKKVSSIPPGTYQVDVTSPMDFQTPDLSATNDFTACKGFAQFQLTGPGVNLHSTIADGGQNQDLLTATFQASSTYIAQDLNQPAVTRSVFTTLASGSPASPTLSGTSSSTSSKSTPASAAVQPFRGALDAIVAVSGKLSLKRNGKAIAFLKQGRWKFSVDDESTKSGFTLKSLRGKAVAITSSSFVGTRDVTLALKQGRWFFYGSTGEKSQFIVLS